MSVYDIQGNDLMTGNVNIRDLRAQHPLWTDDQLLDAAITLAKSAGATAKIIWDGRDIYFDGTTRHVLKGFGGIDFGGATIYMPSVDNGQMLEIVPDTSEDVTVDAGVIHAAYTDSTALKDKVFTLNNNESGNATMCLGSRAGSGFTSVIYCSPCLMTQPDGYYTTGPIYLVPTEGDVVCRNVHDYPEITFELCNATIVSHSGTRMTTFLMCTRSNTHIHHLTLQGQSGVTSYHPGIASITQCYGVEIDHIKGPNPVKADLTSGYALLLSMVTFAYVHDVDIGDGNQISWGVVGCNHLTDTTFERCYLNRWDCHYAQYGANTVRDCVLNQAKYGIGSGEVLFEGCTFVEKRTSTGTVSTIEMRSDMPGVYDGDITVRNCIFRVVSQPVERVVLWLDGNYWPKPSNSMVSGAPARCRAIEKCVLPDGVKSVFQAGCRIESDQGMYANIRYVIRDTTIHCADVMVDARGANDGQALGGITLEHCRVTNPCHIAKLFTDVLIRVNDCGFDSNTARVVKNTQMIAVSGCVLDSVVSDQASSFLSMTGCKVSGEQSFAKFTNYSAYGNISSRGTQYTAELNVSV